MTNGKLENNLPIETLLNSLNSHVKRIEVKHRKIEQGQNSLLKEVSVLKDTLSMHMSTIAHNTTAMTTSLGGVKESLSSIQKTNDNLTNALASKYSVPLVAVMLIILVLGAITISLLLSQNGGKAKFSTSGIEVEHSNHP